MRRRTPKPGTDVKLYLCYYSKMLGDIHRWVHAIRNDNIEIRKTIKSKNIVEDITRKKLNKIYAHRGILNRVSAASLHNAATSKCRL